jgi:predicted RNA-binding Zn ribbon-like protein
MLMVDNTQEACNRLRYLGGYMKGTYNLPAPGQLESVRRFMNTWLVPSATQIPEDRLPALLRDQEAWRREFPEMHRGPDDSAELLANLRDDLRRMVGGGRGWPESFQRWLERFPPMVDVVLSGEATEVRHGPAPDSGAVGWILAVIVDAVADETWFRLKRCPDCQWVFYDRTRSRTKVWCDMLAGDAGGRSCGTIAKVRRYRERQAL